MMYQRRQWKAKDKIKAYHIKRMDDKNKNTAVKERLGRITKDKTQAKEEAAETVQPSDGRAAIHNDNGDKNDDENSKGHGQSILNPLFSLSNNKRRAGEKRDHIGEDLGHVSKGTAQKEPLFEQRLYPVGHEVLRDFAESQGIKVFECRLRLLKL